MGICGTGMGNVAALLQKMGHQVLGSDKGVYPPMSDVLKEAGIQVFEGYDAARLEKLAPDMIVVGNVIPRGNPELEWMLEFQKIPYCSLPQVVQEYVLKNRKNIVVTGTHGKTTTTALAAYLLKRVGVDPGYLIGGVPLSLPSGSNAGSLGSPFVIEGDEYDSAFFDKRSKFIHYIPSILIVNNIEFDHGDIFQDLEDVKRTFSHLFRIVPRNGQVLINGDDPNIASLMPIPWTNVIRVGVGENNDLRILNFKQNKRTASFDLQWKNAHWGGVELPIAGLYNARNAAMAALSVALTLYPQSPLSLNLNLLSDFNGVKRRQEILHEDEQFLVIEDFAHHPTALVETITALRARFPDFKITACFEPRSNTVCRKFHQDTIGQALRSAETVYFGAIFRADIYKDEDRLDTFKIVKELQNNGCEAKAFSANSDLLIQLFEDIIEKSFSPNSKHMICFFSNGSFDGIIQKFVSYLQTASSRSLAALGKR